MIAHRLRARQSALPPLDVRAAALLRRFGASVNVWRPGVENYQDSTGATPAVIDGVVGLVKGSSGINLTQATTGYKPILRKGPINRLTESEFRNGVADAPVRANISASGPIGNFSGGVRFLSSAFVAFAYKTGNPVGVNTTFSVFVKFDDGLPPVFSSASTTSPLNDFILVVGGGSISPVTYKTQAIGSGWYRVSGRTTPSTSSNVGIVKYESNSARAFTASGYQLVIGADQCDYRSTTTLPLSTNGTAGNGVLWWQFDGVDDRLVAAPVINTSAAHLLIAAGYSERASATYCGQRLDANNVGPFIRVTSNAAASAAYYRAGGVVLAANLASPANEFYVRSIMSSRYDGVAISHRRASAAASLNVALPQIANTDFFVGAGGASASLSEFLKGGVYGLIAAQGTVSAAECALLERWLAGKTQTKVG